MLAVVSEAFDGETDGSSLPSPSRCRSFDNTSRLIFIHSDQSRDGVQRTWKDERLPTGAAQGGDRERGRLRFEQVGVDDVAMTGMNSTARYQVSI